MVTNKHKDYQIKVVDYIPRNNLKTLPSHYTESEKRLGLDVIQGKDYRPTMVEVIKEEALKVLKELPKEDFIKEKVREGEGLVTEDIIVKHMHSYMENKNMQVVNICKGTEDYGQFLHIK